MDDLGLLTYRTRASILDKPDGVLVLLHGRGADENDLYPLINVFDPQRRLVGVTPRAPLQLPPGGFHWYVGGGIPTPERDSFLETYELLGRWLAALSEHLEIPFAKILLGGFSQGTVMTHAMVWGAGRPKPAGVLAFSGFMPEVAGFDLDLQGRQGLPVAIGHGTLDNVIGVQWGRQARERLQSSGADLTYQESVMGHTIDSEFANSLSGWVASAFNF